MQLISNKVSLLVNLRDFCYIVGLEKKSDVEMSDYNEGRSF